MPDFLLPIKMLSSTISVLYVFIKSYEVYIKFNKGNNILYAFTNKHIHLLNLIDWTKTWWLSTLAAEKCRAKYASESYFPIINIIWYIFLLWNLCPTRFLFFIEGIFLVNERFHLCNYVVIVFYWWCLNVILALIYNTGVGYKDNIKQNLVAIIKKYYIEFGKNFN